MGVEPLQPGMATFHATFSSVVHFAGRFFSALKPLRFGPRHCGQFSACTALRDNKMIARMPIAPCFIAELSFGHEVSTTCGSGWVYSATSRSRTHPLPQVVLTSLL